MLNPAIGKLLNSEQSKYAIVIAVAKRARKIAEENEKQSEIINEKPVNTAINDIASGKYIISED